MRHRGYRGPGLHLPSRAVAAVAGRERLCVEVLGPIRVLDADGRDVTPVRNAAAAAAGLAGAPSGPGRVGGLRRRGPVALGAAGRSCGGPAEPPVPPAPRHARGRDRGGRRRLPARRRGGSISTRTACRRCSTPAATADEAALAELDALLARWSGPAYPELDEVDDGRAEAARLEELQDRASAR